MVLPWKYPIGNRSLNVLLVVMGDDGTDNALQLVVAAAANVIDAADATSVSFVVSVRSRFRLCLFPSSWQVLSSQLSDEFCSRGAFCGGILRSESDVATDVEDTMFGSPSLLDSFLLRFRSRFSRSFRFRFSSKAFSLAITACMDV